jgi:hypothetical protein
MQNTTDTTILVVKQMVNYCQEIQKLLAGDQTLLINNDLNALIASNKQKADLLEQLTLQKNALKQSGHTALNDPTLSTKLNQLKNELSTCYQFTVTNYQVIYANLTHLKNIWDQVLATQEKANCTYDHTGSLNK